MTRAGGWSHIKHWKQSESAEATERNINGQGAAKQPPLNSADIIQAWYLIDICVCPEEATVSYRVKADRSESYVNEAVTRCQQQGRWMTPFDKAVLTIGCVTKTACRSVEAAAFFPTRGSIYCIFAGPFSLPLWSWAGESKCEGLLDVWHSSATFLQVSS